MCSVSMFGFGWYISTADTYRNKYIVVWPGGLRSIAVAMPH